MSEADPRIALVGEAYGEQEALVNAPFIGAAGQELTRMLSDAGISRQDCLLTNVFNERPPSNDVSFFFTDKIAGIANLGAYRVGNRTRYLRPDFAHHIPRLTSEIARANIVVALGNTALWALTGQNGITNLRGYILPGRIHPKVLPTFHPASVLRQWNQRLLVVLDLMKAARESSSPELVHQDPRILVPESPDDILEWFSPPPGAILSFDIETSGGLITCIGFSFDPSEALVVPFFDPEGGPFWPSPGLEAAAWHAVRIILESDVPKVGQNGLYDIQYLLKNGIAVRNYSHDTMLLQHAILPESKKGLGFLASIYTNFAHWKDLRTTETKRDA